MQQCNNALHTTQRGNTAQPENETESHKDDATEVLDVCLFPQDKLALIKLMALAMLRLLQERAEHQGMQHQFLRTEGLPNDASTIVLKGMLNSNACTTTEC